MASSGTTSLTMASSSTTNGQRVSCASAPGKVILFGEHAVVFGQPAIAAALSALRIHVMVTSTNTRRVDVSMPDLPNPLKVSFAASSLVNTTFKGPPTRQNAACIHDMLLQSSGDLDEIAMSALTPLVYLLNKLTPKIFPSGMNIVVRSQDLPVGAGLGSSAAFSVALVAALFGLSLHTPLGKPSSRQLEVINQYAFYSEILLHGTPSGIDNAVSTYGKAIVYTKGDGNVSMEHLEMPPLNMILTHTHVPRSTKMLVAGVRAMYDKHTAVVQGMLDSMGAIVRQFREMITAKDDFESKGEEMMTLVRTNQHLLRAAGVSHPSLDMICEVVDEVSNGAAATKLTGAGGGGCAMTLLRQDADPKLPYKIQAALKAQSSKRWRFSCLTSTVGGDGVLWTDPDSFVAKDAPEKVTTSSEGDGEEKSYRIPVAIAVAAAAILATRLVSR